MMANTITSALRANMDVHFWRRTLGCITKSSQMSLGMTEEGTDSNKRHLSYFHRWSHDGPLLFCYNRYMTKSLLQEHVSSMIKPGDVLNDMSVKYGEKIGLIIQSHIPPCLTYMLYCVVEKPQRVGVGNKRKRK